MKWVNHILIGGSLAAAINPLMVPVAILGSTAPDWMENILNRFGQRVKHRAATHYVSAWVLGMLFGLFVWDFHGLISGLRLGDLPM